MQERDNDNFSFINEKIKEKPLNKRRLLLHVGYIAGVAAVFGVVASLVFAFFQPKFSQMLYPEQEPVVTIPKDDIVDTEATEQVNTEATEQQEPEVPALPEPREFEIADFQNLQNELYAVGREANRFVVTVTGVKSDTDWFNNAYESKGQASGIIIADNGQELLILTERKVISGAQEIFVTFINDVTVEASMKKYDGNTGIAVLSVSHEEVDEETMNAIAVAELGNSLVTPQGMIAIAVGSPLGTTYSILTGSITSTTNSISTVDMNYTVFTTDIVGSSKGSGVLINASGQVIGLVMQDYSSDGDQNTLTAISISELKTLIEMLSNNQDIPYIGLELTTVTNDIANEYDIPKGAYIKEVKMDSPAMAAGLQKGDVITKMGGEAIYTVDSYESKLLELKPDERVKIVVERQGTSGYKEITCTVDVSVLQ
ncbi:MAG: S1C family serine protease [Clostridiales bacterium]|nr:S1C family serine protease [Roseburia sp.]MDD7635341.1 S1C family serine protease [Clostridiales bacterium]MDY4112715.1 S1C family serine protease [Roseburia sp.]